MASIDKPRKSIQQFSSLEEMRIQMRHQTGELFAFSYGLKLSQKERETDLSKLVFTGSGDSYASSLFAHYLSGGLAAVADPYELQSYNGLASGRTVFITSVSGRTAANIQVARRLRGVARRRVAVTADPASPLSKECDRTVQLEYFGSGVLTAGTVSFTSSLLALAWQIQELPNLEGLKRIMLRATQWASDVKHSAKGRLVFVGSGIGYALAAYGAFKIHEVLGRSADYAHTEQLGHSQLFSLGPQDMVVGVASLEDKKTAQTCDALKKIGLRTRVFTGHDRDPVLFALEAAFALQHFALKLAEAEGREECAFLLDPERLSLSSRLIY